jgi:uncharacterized protein YecE (DUF72 family)
MITWHLGTMGFSYTEWRGVFYPESASPQTYLRTYARIFNAVELDTTFYGIPDASRIRGWRNQVPEGFVFCPKTPRAITHEGDLAGNFSRMEAFLDTVAHFEQRLGAVLIQFPPQFTAERYEELLGFLDGLPGSFSFAVEVRHRSWLATRLQDELRTRGLSWVSAEYVILEPEYVATTDFVYLRFLGRHGQFPRKNQVQLNVRPVLNRWWDRLRPELDRLHTVFGFFNDDFAGHAPASCNAFKEIAGLPVTRPDLPTQGRMF